ncbi:hypothetical protein WJX74_008099 [Apatococcus lobatus]|uniref:Uncharacterized protein n=1 Tax=Apatococcus lobatus TaxID=904363 RepID=A0AAW1QZU9_9CHLO
MRTLENNPADPVSQAEHGRRDGVSALSQLQLDKIGQYSTREGGDDSVLNLTSLGSCGLWFKLDCISQPLACLQLLLLTCCWRFSQGPDEACRCGLAATRWLRSCNVPAAGDSGQEPKHAPDAGYQLGTMIDSPEAGMRPTPARHRPRSLPGVYDGPSVEASLVARTPPAPDQGKPEVLHRLRQPAALWSKPGQETGHSDIDGDASSSDAEQDGALQYDACRGSCRIPPLDAVVIDNLKAKAAIVISATPLVERLLKEAKADFDRVASGHQVKTNDQLAVIYNDAMPLEEHHAAAALGLGIPILIAALLRDGCQPRRQHYERPCLRRSSAAGRHGISVQPSACVR